MRDRGKPSEVIGEIGHSGYLTKTSATDSAAATTRITIGPTPFACFTDTWTVGSGGTTIQWPPPLTETR